MFVEVLSSYVHKINFYLQSLVFQPFDWLRNAFHFSMKQNKSDALFSGKYGWFLGL